MAGFRTIVINKRCKLESRLGTLVIRSETEECIHLSEIETLLIESTSVSLTAALIADLTEAGTNIIFCDRAHLPAAVFLPVHAHFSVSKNIKEQIAWTNERKAECWKYIIKEKIRQQAKHLADMNKTGESLVLTHYQESVQNADFENFEARAAGIYFRAILGKSFNRNLACFENDALNYGYSLIMAAFSREIFACGYLTELGLWHRGAENAFNLASDLMEPFRIVVDRYLLKMSDNDKAAYKRKMLKLMYSRIKINGENQSLIPAIRIYLHRIFRFMRSEVQEIFNIEIITSENDEL